MFHVIVSCQLLMHYSCMCITRVKLPMLRGSSIYNVHMGGGSCGRPQGRWGQSYVDRDEELDFLVDIINGDLPYTFVPMAASNDYS